MAITAADDPHFCGGIQVRPELHLTAGKAPAGTAAVAILSTGPSPGYRLTTRNELTFPPGPPVELA
jgi:hypothetical protein